MNKIIKFLLILLFINSCSLDTKSGFWTKSEKLIKINSVKTKKLFFKDEILEKEFNTKIKIKLKGNYFAKSFLNNLTNNNGHLNYKGPIEKTSKYKFKKINNFVESDPELLFTNNKSIVFYDNTRSILKFDKNSELKWKTNIYNKAEKKLDPTLSFASNDKIIIVADNLGKYYSIDLFTGKMIWSKKNSDPFNSQIKILGDKFFIVDYSNTLRCFSVNDGREIWKFKSTLPLVKAKQKLSLVLSKNLVVFLNSVGELTGVNNVSGNLIWQTTTQDNFTADNSFSIKYSDLVLNKNSLYFSNSNNDFYSVNLNTGTIIWKQKINSNLRPTVIDNLIFSVTLEGYLVLLDKINGNILRITNIYDKIKKPRKGKIKPTGFIVGQNQIYLSLDNGKLIVIDILNGKPVKIVKVASNKISRPHIFNKNMYLIKDNAIIKIN